MKLVYADFNDIASDGTLPLTCRGSVQSIAELGESLQDGEEIWLSDGELHVKARAFRRGDGTWEGRSDWHFEKQNGSSTIGTGAEAASGQDPCIDDE